MRSLVLLALVGLGAQLVDGSLGMGYGVTAATRPRGDVRPSTVVPPKVE